MKKEKIFWDNGNLKCEINWSNNLKHGVEKHFFKLFGGVKKIIKYRDGNINGKYKEFYNKTRFDKINPQKLKVLGSYKNNLKSGQFIYFRYEWNSTFVEIKNYLNGSLFGLQVKIKIDNTNDVSLNDLEDVLSIIKSKKNLISVDFEKVNILTNFLVDFYGEKDVFIYHLEKHNKKKVVKVSVINNLNSLSHPLFLEDLRLKVVKSIQNKIKESFIYYHFPLNHKIEKQLNDKKLLFDINFEVIPIQLTLIERVDFVNTYNREIKRTFKWSKSGVLLNLKYEYDDNLIIRNYNPDGKISLEEISTGNLKLKKLFNKEGVLVEEIIKTSGVEIDRDWINGIIDCEEVDFPDGECEIFRRYGRSEDKNGFLDNLKKFSSSEIE